MITNTEFLENQYRTVVFMPSQSQPNELLQTHTTGSYTFTAASGHLYTNVPFGTEYRGYDRNGDTTAITSTDPFTSKYYINVQLTYDAQARPITITTNEQPCLGVYIPITVTMAYNAQGQRSHYTVTMSNTTVLDEHYQYRGAELGQMSAVTATLHTGCPGSTVGNGSYSDTYLYDQQGNPLELIRQQLGTTKRYWYQTDGQGDVRVGRAHRP